VATIEAGTTTTLLGAQVVGMVTLVGTKTTDEAGIETIAVLGMLQTKLLETDDGTLVKSTMATEVDEAITMISLNGNEVTYESGTTTGDDQVVGTVTVCGTVTNELTGTSTTAVDGTDWMIDDGTQVGR